MSDFSPREIVSELDRHIVGQRDAKRAVAIALRNCWRRQQIIGPMREEVLPKNIWDQDLTASSMDEIRRIGNRGAQILFGHDDSQIKTLKTGVQFYD